MDSSTSEENNIISDSDNSKDNSDFDYKFDESVVSDGSHDSDNKQNAKMDSLKVKSNNFKNTALDSLTDNSKNPDVNSPIYRNKTWRRKNTIIESDSETQSDDSSASSEESAHVSFNSSKTFNDVESIVILTSDSDDDDDDVVRETPVIKESISAVKTDETVSSNSSQNSVNDKETEADIISPVKPIKTKSLNPLQNSVESKETEDNTSGASAFLEKSNILLEIKPNTVSYPTLNPTIAGTKKKENINIANNQEYIIVTHAEYLQQTDKVAHLKKNSSTLKASLASVDFKSMRDQGKCLIDREKSIRELLKEECSKLERMKISEVPKPRRSLAAAVPTWDQLQREAALVQPSTFGKTAVKTIDTQRTMTMEGLRNLHSSLEERPAEDVLAETPPLCKAELMPHQRHALSFMKWRETKQPSGGLLADDMGLGKTLTVICLCLDTLAETQKAQRSKDWKSKSRPIRPAGVLVVCPASVMGQWVKEVKERLRRNCFDVLEYHGPNRQKDVRLLHRVDMVLTTFSTLAREHITNSELYNLKWRRVVLDEAHQVRNFKTQASEAACALRAQSRWALTGTPVHNKELDMYGIMKFLHCEPFDDLAVWKRWVGNKGTGGQQRLHSALQALMLRRTKADMIASGALCTFPERNLETIAVQLDRDEQLIYSKMMVFSRNLFAQFLQQRAEKQGFTNNYKDGHFDKMRRQVLKINQYKDVKQSQILVLLLRLRQICIHPTLITNMLETTDIENVGTDANDPSDGKEEMFDLLDQLDKLKLQDNIGNAKQHEDTPEEPHPDVVGAAAADPMTLNEAVKSVFRKDHPVFDPKRKSSKVRTCLELLKTNILPLGEKAILVSQWTSLLKLIAEHLREEGIQFCSLDGTVKISDRQGLIDQLNNPKSPCKIMLLSLTAGGVGLNLVGANHLLILDPHWNPQLESQAQDRIYRMGQTKLVHIYRLLATDSIEERISALQMKKLELAHGMLTGTTVAGSKLSLDDLRMLFNM